MFTLTLALTGALLIQTPPPAAQSTDPQMAQVEEVMGLVNRMFGTLGTCDRVLPPELGQQLRAGIAGQDDPDAREAMQTLMTTYEAGKASPEAATITQEQCVARIQAINVEMQALKAEIESSVAAAQ